MSFLLFTALASGAAVVLLAIGAGMHKHHRRRHRHTPLVTSLYLGAIDMSNAIVGTPKLFKITPADSFGVAVDLVKFPTALTDIVWSVSNPDIAAVNTTKPDSTEAAVTFSADGVVTVKVTGKDKDGADVTEQVDVTGELPVPKVVSLNLVEA